MRNDNTPNCGCTIAILIFNIFVGAWSVDHLLNLFLGKDIPFWADAVIGLFVAELSVPAAIILAILQHFGVF